MRDHGGNLDWAIRTYGGAEADWIDLSTGINPRPYPVGQITVKSWSTLPTQSNMTRLSRAAQRVYQTGWPALPVAGAQAAIQIVPYLSGPGSARILSPTYNEHAASLRAASWTVEEVGGLEQLHGADLAVVVNPNNPDGRQHDPASLRQIAESVGTLVVDESFADVAPGLSVLAGPEVKNMIVLRSFGKFYGLAGLRLGFVLGSDATLGPIRQHSGPWPVSGPAIDIAVAAFQDRQWIDDTRKRLAVDAARLDALADRAGWSLVGGCDLFRTYATPAAPRARDALAEARIWSRIFPWSESWLRLGLPDGADQWKRIEQALAGEPK